MTLQITPGLTILEAMHRLYVVFAERCSGAPMEFISNGDFDNYQYRYYDKCLNLEYFIKQFLSKEDNFNPTGKSGLGFSDHVFPRPNINPYAYELVGKTYTQIDHDLYRVQFVNPYVYTTPLIDTMERQPHSNYGLEKFFTFTGSLDDYSGYGKTLPPNKNYFGQYLSYHAEYWNLILTKIRSYPQALFGSYTRSVQIVYRYVYYPGSSHYISDFYGKTESELISEATSHWNSIIDSLTVTSSGKLDFTTGRVINHKNVGYGTYSYDKDYGFYYYIQAMVIKSLHYIEISNPAFKYYNSYYNNYTSSRVNYNYDIQLTSVNTTSPYDGYLNGNEIMQSLYAGTHSTSGTKAPDSPYYNSFNPDYTYYYPSSMDEAAIKSYLKANIGFVVEGSSQPQILNLEACGYFKCKQHESNFVY